MNLEFFLAHASTLMTSHPLSIPLNMAVEDAARIFSARMIKVVPVVDDESKPIGVLTQMALLEAMIRKQIPNSAIEKISDIAAEIHPANCVEMDASMEEVYKALVEAPSDRILVVDGRGRLQGIISPYDFLTYLLGEEKRTMSLLEEIEDLHLRLEDSNKEKAVYQKWLDQQPFTMIVTDTRDNVDFVNQRFESEIGRNLKLVLGRPFLNLFEDEEHPKVQRILGRVRDEQSHPMIYVNFKAPDNKVHRAALVSSSIINKLGIYEGSIFVIRRLDSDKLMRAMHEEVLLLGARGQEWIVPASHEVGGRRENCLAVWAYGL